MIGIKNSCNRRKWNIQQQNTNWYCDMTHLYYILKWKKYWKNNKEMQQTSNILKGISSYRYVGYAKSPT